jgi:hypothetical protein
MHVKHGLISVVSRIHHEPVPRLRNSLLDRDSRRNGHHPAKDWFVSFVYVARGGDVFARNDHEVDWSALFRMRFGHIESNYKIVLKQE